MSEDNFIARWSRRKREADREKLSTDAGRADPRRPGDDATAAGAPTPGQENAVVEPAFDPATLPPIDSIVAGSDIRAFLQKNVPAELTKAALRRAWTTDPAIRDFIGIAENQWDFTDPTSIPGFGPLEAGSNVQELIAQAMGKLPSPTEITGMTEESEPPGAKAAEPTRPQAVRTTATAALSERDAPVMQSPADPAAPQHPEPAANNDSRGRKAHGRAMPR
jgi:hypothetical protein